CAGRCLADDGRHADLAWDPNHFNKEARGEAGKLAEPITVFGLERIQVKLRVDLAEFREPPSAAGLPPANPSGAQ
ncbi:MAG: hypothetical protein NTY01_13785, partial [Verrucomicrobia bacterium]|nr:hypothetical protein [Verrucomicrobiota bacterium]